MASYQGTVNLAIGEGIVVDLGSPMSFVKVDAITGEMQYQLVADGTAPAAPVAVMLAAAPATTANTFRLSAATFREHGAYGDDRSLSTQWRYIRVWAVATGALAVQAET